MIHVKWIAEPSSIREKDVPIFNVKVVHKDKVCSVYLPATLDEEKGYWKVDVEKLKGYVYEEVLEVISDGWFLRKKLEDVSAENKKLLVDALLSFIYHAPLEYDPLDFQGNVYSASLYGEDVVRQVYRLLDERVESGDF